jgi:hypothetical protein
MKPLYLVAVFVALLLEACLEIPPLPTRTTTVTESATARPTETEAPTRTPRQTARVLPEVLSVRDSAGGIVIDWLQADQLVTVIECKDKWCQISTNVLTGYVFRGCLSGNTDLGCSAK